MPRVKKKIVSQGKPVGCVAQEGAGLIIVLSVLAYHYRMPHVARHPETVYSVKNIGFFPLGAYVLSIQYRSYAVESEKDKNFQSND